MGATEHCKVGITNLYAQNTDILYYSWLCTPFWLNNIEKAPQSGNCSFIRGSD